MDSKKSGSQLARVNSAVHPAQCGLRRSWTLDGIHYSICNYDSSFQIAFLDPADIKYYKQIILLERESGKNR